MFDENFFEAFKETLPKFYLLLSSSIVIWLYLNELEKKIDEIIKEIEEKSQEVEWNFSKFYFQFYSYLFLFIFVY